MDNKIRIIMLSKALEGLTQSQLQWIKSIVEQFRRGAEFKLFSQHDIFNGCVLNDFGDTLRIHHCFSKEPFTKDKFEYALEQVVNLCGGVAKLAPKGRPSFDITINDFTISLKTEAGKSINEGFVHISKFMELGKGKWGNKKSDLVGLRESFFEHMERYQRILILRCLSQGVPFWHYELVEIPRRLLLKAKDGELEMKHKSIQSPKPGYCHVRDGKNLLFQLYFDGGTERKLQIKRLDKRQCTLVAEWRFESNTLTGPVSET